MTNPEDTRQNTATSPANIVVQEMQYEFEDFLYRAPLKFAGTLVDRATLLHVRCIVRATDGRTSSGFGSMPLGNVWSFPSATLSYDDTLGAMKALAERLAGITADCSESGHPIDLNHVLEGEYFAAAEQLSKDLQLSESIPRLCTLVTASAMDAAIHDAYGKLHGVSCYGTYGSEFVARDLGHYLGAEFRGDQLGRYLRTEPKATMPLYHLVGAVDPLVESDLASRLGDGLPETLPEWIEYNGLTHLKIKLNGNDPDWDVQRVQAVDRVASSAQQARGVDRWFYSCDFNELCPDVGYLLDFLHRLREDSPAAFDRIQYIEQPTKRDLAADRENRMHEAAALRPVVIDESLVDLESLLLAREMGYTGVALKACKGQSQSLLMAAAAQKFGMFLCVQDLTCPGASLIHSAGLAAHVPGVAAIEANARQFMPEANLAWADKMPEIFVVTNGLMKTGALTGPGLGAV